ncbi:protelomerase family protein [Nocardia sp. NPDC049737]|uniref:protelomerase family protein n=1 Tax=Nocardia sp. NPDC049737 TaxID=3154358 RepID=UPI0034179CBB
MIALSELSWIHNRRKPDGEKFSVLTTRKLIIAYRNAIREAFGEEAAILETLRYSPARADDFKAHQIETREARHRDQRPLDAEEHVESALLLLGHAVKMRWSTPAAIAGLCALTGRRPYEVTCTGRFVPVAGNRHEIIFSGQAKTRDDERAAAPFTIPVLGDRELILEAIEMLRGKIDVDMDNKTFSQRYAKEIGLQSKKAFKDAEGNPLKPSDLRDAYAIIAYEEFAPKKVSSVQFMNDILGHKSEYLDTTLYYISFYLVK